MEHSLHSDIQIVHCIAPAALTGNTVGAAIDGAGFESLEYALHVGTAMVGGGFTATVFESETGAFAGEQSVAPADAIRGGLPVISIGDANKTFRFGYIGKMRYTQLALTETGAITGGVVGCMAILGHPKNAPVADQNT